jgi:hypothetical protein
MVEKLTSELAKLKGERAREKIRQRALTRKSPRGTPPPNLEVVTSENTGEEVGGDSLHDNNKVMNSNQETIQTIQVCQVVVELLLILTILMTSTMKI